MKRLLELCRELVAEGNRPATEASFGLTIERIGRELASKGWTRIADELPKHERAEDYGAWINSASVLVTDGVQIAWAYYQFWREENEVRWKLVGRDSYDLYFEPTHWMLPPELP